MLVQATQPFEANEVKMAEDRIKHKTVNILKSLYPNRSIFNVTKVYDFREIILIKKYGRKLM